MGSVQSSPHCVIDAIFVTLSQQNYLNAFEGCACIALGVHSQHAIAKRNRTKNGVKTVVFSANVLTHTVELATYEDMDKD